jgi:hypothetical protein
LGVLLRVAGYVGLAPLPVALLFALKAGGSLKARRAAQILVMTPRF